MTLCLLSASHNSSPSMTKDCVKAKNVTEIELCPIDTKMNIWKNSFSWPLNVCHWFLEITINWRMLIHFQAIHLIYCYDQTCLFIIHVGVIVNFLYEANFIFNSPFNNSSIEMVISPTLVTLPYQKNMLYNRFFVLYTSTICFIGLCSIWIEKETRSIKIYFA